MTVLTFRDVSKFANVNPAIVKKNNNKLFRKQQTANRKVIRLYNRQFRQVSSVICNW